MWILALDLMKFAMKATLINWLHALHERQSAKATSGQLSLAMNRSQSVCGSSAMNKGQSRTIASLSGLSDKEIECMVAEPEQYTETDYTRRNLIENLNQYEPVCAAAEKAVNEFKDHVAKEKLTKLIGELHAIAAQAQSSDAGVTTDAICGKINEIQQMLVGLFQKVSEKRNAQGHAKETPAEEKKDNSARAPSFLLFSCPLLSSRRCFAVTLARPLYITAPGSLGHTIDG